MIKLIYKSNKNEMNTELLPQSRNIKIKIGAQGVRERLLDDNLHLKIRSMQQKLTEMQ